MSNPVSTAEQLKIVALTLKVSGYYREAMTVLRAARELETFYGTSATQGGLASVLTKLSGM